MRTEYDIPLVLTDKETDTELFSNFHKLSIFPQMLSISPHLISKFIFYATLLLHMVHYQRYLPPHLRTDRMFKMWSRYVTWGHGVCVFTLLHGFQIFTTTTTITTTTSTHFDVGITDGELSALHYLAMSLLVVVLWDLGAVHSTAWRFLIPVNLHHSAVFVALLYQPFETATRGWHNTTFFSWIWLIHSFGILNEVLFPLLGVHVKVGERLGSLAVLRHVYAVSTVYFFHGYIGGDGQPGLGWNYQTVAVSLMLGGRYISNNNWKNVPFIRRVEFPGVVVVLVDYFVFGGVDIYCERSFATFLSLFMCYVTYKVFFTYRRPKPAEYNGPCSLNRNARIAELALKFKGEFQQEFPEDFVHADDDDSRGEDGGFNSAKFRGRWFDRQQKGEWIGKYPLIHAVVHDDIQEVERLLALCNNSIVTETTNSNNRNNRDENMEKDKLNNNNDNINDEDSRLKKYKYVNEKMTDYNNSLALGWAVVLERWSIVLVLLLNGSNPYLIYDNNTTDTIMDKCLDGWSGGSKKRREVMFAMFFNRLNEVCLNNSPSIEPAWSDLSVSERILSVLMDM